MIQQPLAHARNLEDRLPAYHTSIRFFCLAGRFEDSLDTCFSILREYGEEVSTDVTSDIVEAEILRTESMLSHFPKDNLPSLSMLDDTMKE